MIGIIGGSGVEEISELADSIEKKIVDTEYGSVEVSLLIIEDKTVAFLPRHSAGHTCPCIWINTNWLMAVWLMDCLELLQILLM